MNTLQKEQGSKLLPLVKAIGSEIRDRATKIAHLEERLEALQSTRTAHAEEIADLTAELAIHRRELRRCTKELVQLGCSVDADNPLRIQCGDESHPVILLDDTRFWSTADTPT